MHLSVFRSAFALFVATAILPFAASAQDAVSPAGCVVDPAAPFGPSGSLVRTLTLTADLSQVNENPAITGRAATGAATITIRLERLSATSAPTRAVLVADLQVTPGQQETITAAHIHSGAPGVNGPVTIPLNPEQAFDLNAGQTGTIRREVVVTAAATLETLTAILANPTASYVNIHSSALPGGLTRGQLRLASSDADACLFTDTRLIRRLVILLATDRGLISAQERDRLLGRGN